MKHYYLFHLLFICLLPSPQGVAAPPPNIQLATPYNEHIKVENYYLSEKYDGIRGRWTGKQLLTRSGNVINTPNFFTQHWPPTPLDGELWVERDEFQAVMSIVRKKTPITTEWKNVRFMVFDLPDHPGTFSKRIEVMKQLIPANKHTYLKMIEQIQVKNNHDLLNYFNAITQQGGEGVMLHHKNSIYKAGRTNNLMKLKPFVDADAMVIEHIGGKGKFHDRLGAILVTTPEGISFKIGSGFTNKERMNPPPIGAIVSYKYSGKTKAGVPRFASFLRIKQLTQDN